MAKTIIVVERSVVVPSKPEPEVSATEATVAGVLGGAVIGTFATCGVLPGIAALYIAGAIAKPFMKDK